MSCAVLSLDNRNVLISSSANALESAVFGPPEGGGARWDKWELEGTGRVEMPLDENSEETFVVGSSLALTSQVEVAISKYYIQAAQRSVQLAHVIMFHLL